ncbi:MAG: ABC transporter ATP-binding protein [Pirellula sp.]|jgi:putative ABC transport system ATP-binding protein|nr:ABC transporter ATP-binding protein [Pirellula sp.]
MASTEIRLQPAYQTEIAIRCKGVTKEFGTGQTRTQVLHGIDLEIPAGQQTFIVGQSGCGKTTLVSVIAGLLDATDGSVELLGTSLDSLRGAALVNFRAKNLGFIFQQFNLLPSLNAIENASVPLLVQGVSRKAAESRAKDLLVQLGMQENLFKYPNQLSGGQQQRVAIARSLVHDPKILICDEPTASLDAESGQAVMKLLNNLASGRDCAVIVVTHDNRIYSYADQIAYIADGKVSKLVKGTVKS